MHHFIDRSGGGKEYDSCDTKLTGKGHRRSSGWVRVWVTSMKSKQHKAEVLEANPERGRRGDFLKITITMPAKMLGDLQTLGLRRRTRGQKDTNISSLVREAVSALLRKEG